MNQFLKNFVLSGCRKASEGEVAFFSAKRWDRRNRADLIESATPCHDAQVVGPYRDSNPLRLTVLPAMSEDYTTAPQHLHLNLNWRILVVVLRRLAHVERKIDKPSQIQALDCMKRNRYEIFNKKPTTDGAWRNSRITNI